MGSAVIVGAGFSGVVTARELIASGWTVILVDPDVRPGRGVAYATPDPSHLLNSPVAAMSIDPDQPGHFLDWCRRRDPEITGSDFVSRTWYGDYLTDALRDTDTSAPGQLTIHRGHVQRIFDSSTGGVTVLLADGVVLAGDIAILAVGNARPGEPVAVDPALRGSPAYAADPWQQGALDHLPEGEVLLIGTGLTAVDVALSLARTGRRHRVTAVSRHGLLPLVHAPSQRRDLTPPRTASTGRLLRWVREQARSTGDWRGVMDGLRPHWNTLWRALPPAEQDRFLRHLARYWEIHRHRMAPLIAASIAAMREEGTLAIETAEIRAVRAHPAGGITVETAAGTRTVDAVINCSGPGRLTRGHPLVRSLVADGLAVAGPHDLGLATGENGQLVRRDDGRSAIYAVGPARRGELWETTAAPELRDQARALAGSLGRYAELVSDWGTKDRRRTGSRP